MLFRFFALPLALAAAPAWAQQAPAADPAPEERPVHRGPGTAAEFLSGVEYQAGDYFTGERVELLTVQNVARLRAGRTVVSASLPWHRIEAPGNVVGGPGGGGLLGLPILVDPTQPAAREVRQGIGDVRLGVGHTLPPVAGAELTLSGQVKLPTASAERGIGTGETDVAVGAEIARRFGPATPYVAIGYTMPGEPTAYDLRNSLSARGGVALELRQGLRANVGYGYAESVSPLVPDQQQVSTGLSANLSSRLNLGLHGNVGLSEGSPDLGAGVSLGVRIF
jgi:hypothetical protein